MTAARRHTVTIASVEDLYWKLVWDVLRLDDIQRGGTKDPEPLAYAAINVCIAAVSLRDWTVAALLGPDATKAEKIGLYEKIRASVAAQVMCEAVANTAKHSSFREDRWIGGSLSIVDVPADEDDPGGLRLQLSPPQPSGGIALNAFLTMEEEWWTTLQNLGIGFPRRPPEWRQRQLRAIFGTPDRIC